MPLFNGGEMRRDFTYIDDIVARRRRLPRQSRRADDGETKAGGSRAPHALYNIGNNRSEELMRMSSS